MERIFVDWLAKHLPPSPWLRLGVGDDAAVIASSGQQDWVVTTDAITDRVDFRIGHVTPEQIGYKALAVNLSDLAAMAAEPVAALVTLVLPKDGALDLAVGVFRGLLPLAERFEVAIAGGDTNVWDGPLVVSITAMGRTTSRGPLLRSGARPGDILLVTGAVGGSILGRHLAPEPRVREALALHAKFPLRAAMDVSDGLAIDAARLADASHCGVALDLAAIPIAEDARRLAASTHRTPLDHALGDGEDFELLLAADPTTAAALVAQPSPAVPLTAIGKFVDQPGLWQQLATGKLAPQEPVGYQH